MREVAIFLVVVESVADDEPVFDRESDVLDLDVHYPAGRLAQQARGPQGLRRPGAEDVLKIRERQPGVDDVFDDDDVSAFESGIESFSMRTSPEDLVLVA